MSKQSKRTLDKADTKRTVTCSFCGQEHRRRSRELAECRDRYRRGLGPISSASRTASDSKSGNEVTRYDSDPLRGDKRAHTIARMRKAGYPARKIAKELGVDLSVVRSVLERIA